MDYILLHTKSKQVRPQKSSFPVPLPADLPNHRLQQMTTILDVNEIKENSATTAAGPIQVASLRE
jgi:hypothetical protein